ncbi:hypothetical protein Ddye_021503 [Dipteronia dyeriana]|uniref:Uncharacterized protein n=1 Tax=Dipteronia dyeriana TaxID=168575 RepID=A0AAD9WXL3_9ROSI|nr:hypothetical protein Ddye_021503 [Dipteronia dyeriana]
MGFSYWAAFGAMSSESKESVNPSLVRMIDDYQSDSNELNLILLDSGSDFGHHDRVTVACPPTYSSVDKVGVSLTKTMTMGCLGAPGEILKQVDQLLFPEDKACLSKMGVSRVVEWGLVGAFQARSFVAEVRRVLKEATDKLAGLEDEVARLNASLKSSKDKLSQTDDRLVDALERLDKAGDDTVIETRGKLMQEYLLCLSDS